MSNQDDGGPALRDCGKKHCHRGAVRKQGRQWLCSMHYRIGQMKATAKRTGKCVPYDWQFECMISWTRGLVCQQCKRQMVWLAVDDQSRVATLQHDRSGTMRLLCRACNTRHATMPGDTFYDLPKDGKWCPDCELVLPSGDFHQDRSRPCGLKSYCKTCSNKRHREWSQRRKGQPA